MASDQYGNWMNPDQQNQGSFGGLGGIGAGLFDIFGSKDPSRYAQKYLNQIPGQVHEQYDPYRQAGLQALPQLQQQFQQMLFNPQNIYSMLGQGFQKSPGYDFSMQEAMNASNNAAAAGGMAGSPSHQRQSMGIAEQLSNQEFQNYLGHMFNLYGQGLSGLGNINQTGFNASSDITKYLTDLLNTQASVGAYGAQNYNTRMGSGLGSLFGGLGSLFGGGGGMSSILNMLG